MDNMTMEEMAKLIQKDHKELVELRNENKQLKNDVEELKKKVNALIDEKNI